jgi:polyhydroxybutyrate depolymerase
MRSTTAAVFVAMALLATTSTMARASAVPAANRTAQPISAQMSPTCTPSRPHASGTSVQTIMTADGSRSYRLHVPPSYTGSSAVPLVLDFHGATSSAVAQEFYSAYSTKADAEGFIVVYPDGLTTAAIPYTHFNAWQLSSPEPNDVAFTNTLLDALESQLCIDTSRVFSTGMSNGGIMSVRLACSMSSRIAAIAPVAGAYYPPDANNINPSETCGDTTPVPIIAFHGTADTVVPFNGGLGGVNGTTNFRLPLDNNTPAEDVLADWSAHNSCVGARQESQIDTEVRLIEYTGCVRNATAQLYAVDGGGHTWPGAVDQAQLGYTTHQISATNLSWAFFVAHPLTLPGAVGGVSLPPDGAPLGARQAPTARNSAFPLVLAAVLAACSVLTAGSLYAVKKRRA